MPRGGRRVGSGRKPKAKGQVLMFNPADGRQSNPALPGVSSQPDYDDVDLLVPPSDLMPAQRRAWRLLAPHAVEQQTLVPATLAGFRQLCRQWVMADVFAAKIGRLGAGSQSASRFVVIALKIDQRLDATLARFKLTGFGKPADKKDPKGQASNTWAEVGR